MRVNNFKQNSIFTLTPHMPEEKGNLEKKHKILSKIRQDLKKKRLIFNETQERFGMSEMTQLVKVKNTSQVKGYPFKMTNSQSSLPPIALKVVPIETKYEKNEHPCHLENMILKELTDNIVNKNISPHITYYLGSQKVSNKSRALKHLNLKRLEVEEKIRTHSNMLLSEFVSGGSLDTWIFNTYENDKTITEVQWKSIVFQLLYTLSVVQHHYKMMHNDFHYGNILIDDSLKPGGYHVYEIDNTKYYIPCSGVIPLLWDCEFSMMYSDKLPGNYANKFIIGPFTYNKATHTTKYDENLLEEDEDPYNVPFNYNEVYDAHYFLTSLLDLYISQELFDWIMKLYPTELIPEDEDSESSSSRSNYSSASPSSSSNEESSNISSSSTITSASSKLSSIASQISKFTIHESKQYLLEGRMINGIEQEFNLPTPKQLLKNEFFKSFTVKPDDFDETTAVYFRAGF
jgi:hypothetical protein